MASITLPRPSRKGNLANVVISNLYNIGPSVAGIGRETKEKRSRAWVPRNGLRHAPSETRIRLYSPMAK